MTVPPLPMVQRWDDTTGDYVWVPKTPANTAFQIEATDDGEKWTLVHDRLLSYLRPEALSIGRTYRQYHKGSRTRLVETDE